jgi:hypothetical protein
VACISAIFREKTPCTRTILHIICFSPRYNNLLEFFDATKILKIFKSLFWSLKLIKYNKANIIKFERNIYIKKDLKLCVEIYKRLVDYILLFYIYIYIYIYELLNIFKQLNIIN